MQRACLPHLSFQGSRAHGCSVSCPPLSYLQAQALRLTIASSTSKCGLWTKRLRRATLCRGVLCSVLCNFSKAWDSGSSRRVLFERVFHREKNALELTQSLPPTLELCQKLEFWYSEQRQNCTMLVVMHTTGTLFLHQRGAALRGRPLNSGASCATYKRHTAWGPDQGCIQREAMLCSGALYCK